MRKTNQSYQSRRRKRRNRRNQYTVTKTLSGVIITVVLVMGVTAGIKVLGKNIKETEAISSTVKETVLKKDVMIDDLSITGMSREEARKAIESKYLWNMRVTYKEEEYQLKNLLESKIETLLEEIYTNEPKERYTLSFDGLEEEIEGEVKLIAQKWDIAAKNGSISEYNKETGEFIYSSEQNGFVIDQAQLTSDILTQLKEKNLQAQIPAVGKEVAPEITVDQAKKRYQVIGIYTTTTTSNKDRNKNIELASTAIDGMILKPGEEFSFNTATGERSTDKGYRPAGAYLNGVLIEEPGGGVCQVSSTLYNAVVFSGLTTTERHAHSYEPSYVTPGEDAMVSFGGPDMKFVNNSSAAVAIRSSFSNQKLKVSIIGIPILEEGVTLSMKSQKTAELDAPAPVYEENQTLQLDEEKIVKEETKGSRWVTNLVKKKDGTVISDEFFHNSVYRGKSATIQRNTSGVVIPETVPEETAAIEESMGAEESTIASETEKPKNILVTEAHTEKYVPSESIKNQGPTVSETEAPIEVEYIIPPSPVS